MTIITNNNIKQLILQYKNKNLPSDLINIPIGDWDVSRVTNMNGLFFGYSGFNEPLDKWNVSNVTDMSYMFENATNFNQPLDNWNVSNVTNMSRMFENAKKFNQPLGNWNVGNVEYIEYMFSGAISFNQPLGNWNVSKVRVMTYMFSGAISFNQPLDNWNVSNVRNMEYMFKDAKNFNQPLNNWNVSNVTNMRSMFNGAISFNQPLDNWNVNKVTSMEAMFKNAKNFNQPLDNWNVNTVDTVFGFQNMFEGATSFNHKIPTPVVRKSYMDFYKSSRPDNVFNKFNEMMQTFDKPLTLTNSDTNNYINDSMLYEQTNPYIVHYEIFEGKSFPIITILKGTVLFTGRVNQSTYLNTSFFHLYKLYSNPSLDKYIINDFESSLTYFFPIPYMAAVINHDFQTMDMVVLTKDVRLLCLISPSPITREVKSNRDYISYTKTCQSRAYDICLTSKLIYGLKLNGYIGIAYNDSLANYDSIHTLRPFYKNYKSSLLYLSSCFNNAINKKRGNSSGTGFIDEMIDERTYGIPEVVLIPYDIHSYTEPSVYQTVYNDFANNLSSNTVDDSHFIFKYVFHVNGRDIIDVSKKVTEQLRLMPSGKLQKSLQCFPLLNILTDEVDPDKMDYVVEPTYPTTLNDVAFINSYLTPSTSKCAFETVYFYHKLEKTIEQRGGSVLITENVPLKIESKIMPKQDLIIPFPEKKIAKDSTSAVYYKEVNGIPVFAIVDKRIKPRKIGGTRKTTKKVKTRRKVKTRKNKSKKMRRL
jgi:surface protein